MPNARALGHRTARTCRLALPLTAIALALTACGGGDDTPAARAPLTGPAGEVVAMGPDLLASGTYTVSDCTSSNGSAISRKLRLNDDGSMQWLDASNNDAVLTSFSPSNTAHERRRFELYAGGNYNFEVYRVRHTETDNTLRSVVEVGFSIQPEEVSVRWRTNDSETREACRVASVRGSGSGRAQAQAALDTAAVVVNIPVTLDDTIAARRIGSAVRLNNAADGLSDTTAVSYRNSNDDIVTEQLLRSIGNNGLISQRRDSNPAEPWGNWIAALKSSVTMNRGTYEEYFDATGYDQSTGVPGNPQVSLYAAHPTLTYGNGQQSVITLARNTDAPSPVIVFFPLNNF